MNPLPQKEVQAPPDASRMVAFILEHTKIVSPSLLPELSLYLAEESLPIWRKMEDFLSEHNVPPPFWAFAWPGGQALARYILDHPEEIKGRRVVDIGAGSGLTGIAAAVAGAACVVAFDIDAVACEAIALNAKLNDVRIETSGNDILLEEASGVDVLLVGDLFYERPLAEKVLRFLRRACEQNIKILIGDPERTYFPREQFCCVTQYDVPVSMDLEETSLKRTAVWQMTD